MIRYARRLVGVVAVAAALLLACSDGSTRLEALRADPLADVELPDALDVRLSESAGRVGGGVGAPATVRRTFTVPEGGVGAAMEALAEAARAAGWSVTERSPNGFVGEKDVGGYSAQLLIAGVENENVTWVEISTRDS